MKMEMTVAALSVASASAFVAPSAFNGVALKAAAPSSSSAMKMGFENELGAQAPLGFWDPLGLLADADQERFDRLRYVEIKHGRIAMLAVVGHLTAQNWRFPGLISSTEGLNFADIPNGLAAFSKLPVAGTAQIIAFIGFLELYIMKNVEGSFPGNFCLGGTIKEWDDWSDAKKMQKRAIELNNGRAAQMGILGMMVHEQLSNEPYIINTILGAKYTFN